MTSLYNARWIYFGDYHKPEFVPELTQLGFRIIYNDINDIYYIL